MLIDKKGVFLLFFLFFPALFFFAVIQEVSAQPSLQPPHQYYGSVTINGEPAIDGLMITAEADGDDVAATTTLDGMYGYDSLFAVQGVADGELLRFFIQGQDSGLTAVFSSQNSSTTRIDLEIQGDLFCGDNMCGADESCTSCADDCGSCATGGSGSSRGSSASSAQSGSDPIVVIINQSTDNGDNSSCDPEWICSEWIECISGKQRRVCVDASRCGNDTLRPDEERDCISQDAVQMKPELEIQQKESSSDQAVKNSNSISAGSLLVTGIMLVVLLILVGVFIFFLVRHVRRR